MLLTIALLFALYSQTISANSLAAPEPVAAPDGVIDLPNGGIAYYAGAKPNIITRSLVDRTTGNGCHANNALRSLRGASAQGTAFCSSYLSIGTSRSVLTTTTPGVTSTTTTTTTTTAPAPTLKKRTFQTSVFRSKYSPSEISSACSCLSVTPTVTRLTSTDTATTTTTTTTSVQTIVPAPVCRAGGSPCDFSNPGACCSLVCAGSYNPDGTSAPAHCCTVVEGGGTFCS